MDQNTIDFQGQPGSHLCVGWSEGEWRQDGVRFSQSKVVSWIKTDVLSHRKRLIKREIKGGGTCGLLVWVAGIADGLVEGESLGARARTSSKAADVEFVVSNGYSEVRMSEPIDAQFIVQINGVAGRKDIRYRVDLESLGP